MIASNSIKVSVIIPVYNAARYLPQCLDSLLAQTLKEIEIILIDDCSDDDSGTICKQYARRDSRFRVIHNSRNMRQGPSRNTGIEMARGEYIGFVDADDWIDPDYYEKLYSAAISRGYDIAKTEAIIVDENQHKIPQKFQNQQIKHGLEKGQPLHLLFTYEHWTAIYRREMLIQRHIRYPDIRNAQDDVFLLYCTWFAPRLVLIDDTFYYYRQHEGSVTVERKVPYFESKLQCFDLQVHFLNSVEASEKVYATAFFSYLYSIRYQAERMPDAIRHAFGKQYYQMAARTVAQYRYGGAEKILEYMQAGLEGQRDFDHIRNSYAYRIGSALLRLPARIKELF